MNKRRRVVAVTQNDSIWQGLKRSLLLFDQIAVIGLQAALDGVRTLALGEADQCPDIEWLREQGLLFEATMSRARFDQFLELDEGFRNYAMAGSALRNWTENVERSLSEFRRGFTPDFLRNVGVPPPPESDLRLHSHFLKTVMNLHRLTSLEGLSDLELTYDRANRHVQTRIFSYVLDIPETPIAEVVPTYTWRPLVDIAGLFNLLLERNEDHITATPSCSPCVNIVLQAMPEPDENTPWERIIEFKDDPDSERRLVALRHWMARFSEDRKPQEIRQELESLLFDYEQHMKLHRIKVNKGTLETILRVAAGVAEDLVHFRFKSVVEGLFIARERKIQLLEAELQAPGHAVGYIMHAHEAFPSV